MNVDKEAPADVAAGWLEENDLLAEEPALTGSIVIGSSNFNEQELVAEMVAQVLEARGVTVERKFKLGERARWWRRHWRTATSTPTSSTSAAISRSSKGSRPVTSRRP